MSDFFMPRTNSVQDNSVNDFWKQQNEYAEAKAEERLKNRQAYGVELSDQEYAQINSLIADSENQSEEAHKIGSAILFSKQLNIPVDQAYANLDSYVEALWGKEKSTSYRNAFTAIGDMFKIGMNSIELGNLGLKLQQAEYDGDEELTKQIYETIKALDDDNALRQDNAPRTWLTEAIKTGAQTLPFSGQAAGLGVFGNFLAPGLGTVLAFGSSASLAAGQEYIDMRKEGISASTAAKVSSISGGIQGLIEVALGTTTEYLAAGAGEKLTESAAGKLAKKASENFAKRFHYGAGKKLAVDYVTKWTADKFDEGLEEAVQEITSIIGQDVARSMDGLGLSEETIAEKTKQVMDAFKGGVVGAIVLGLPLDVVNVNAQVKDYKKVQEAAKEIPSEAAFTELVKDNPVFSEIENDKKAQIIHEIWQRGQSENEAEFNLKAKENAEVIGSSEQFEQEQTDEETGDTIIEPEFRNEDTGKLHIQNEITSQEENGNYTGVYAAGNPTQENGNQYATIKYTVDENTKTVTIDELQMAKTRLDLRGEVFDNFAQDFAGYEIKYDPIGKLANEWKQEFIDANPSGINNGLNYYSTTEAVEDLNTRKKVAAEIKNNIKNISDKEAAAGVALLEAAAKRMGYSVTEYVDKTFGTNIFGAAEEAQKLAEQQGATFQGKAGATTWKQLGRDIKAVIYAGENADFSTWAHELAHVFQAQLEGDLKTEAENAFNVKNGDWINSTYNGLSSAEAFAYGFQDWLKTGKAENEAMKNIFQKFAEYVSRCFNAMKHHIQFTPEIESVYNQLLKGDDSMLAAAERAVEQQDREQKKAEAAKKASEEKAAEEKAQQQKQAQEEQQTDESEVIMREETAEEEQTAEPAPQEEITENDTVAEALENTNLTEDEKQNVAEVLNDSESSLQEKVEAADEAAESAYDDGNTLPLDYPLFQLIGELGATNLDRVEEVTTRMDNLEVAKEMFKAGKTMERTRLATGWEMGVEGKWRYEIADDYKLKNNRYTNRKLRNYEEELKKAKKELAVYTEATEEEAKKIRRKIEVAVQHNAMPEGTTFESMQQEAENKVNMYELLLQYDDILDVDAALKMLIENGVADPNNFWDIGENFYLNQIIDNEELFNAYPQLEKYIIEFTKKRDGHKGRLDPENKVITIYPDAVTSYQEFKSSLAHEVQHAIQHIEDFAEGGSVDSVANESYKKFLGIASNARIMAQKVIEADNKLKELSEYKALENVEYFDNQYAALEAKLHETETYKTALKLSQEFSNTYPYFDTHKLLEDFKNHTEEIYQKHLKDYKLSPYQIYHSLAGEVEARNVQRRMNMTAEQRLETLLLDTEDVAREDQLIMKGALQIASEEANNILFQTFEEAQKQYPNIVDVSEAFNNTPTPQVLKEHLKNVMGTIYTVQQNGDKLVSPTTREGIKHLANSSQYVGLKGAKRLRHDTYVKEAENLIKNATLVSVEENTKKDKKPNVDKVYHYEVPVYINGHGWNVEIVAEKNKAAGKLENAKPDASAAINNATNILKNIQVSYLYDMLEQKPMLFQDEDPSLYGVHNLSEDAIKHVFKMGGLANPSLAVMDKDVGVHTNFGAISLIAYNSLINKSTGKNSGTYGADVYSPRYPNITKTVTETGRKKLKSIFWAIEDENLRDHFVENTAQKFENERKPSFEYTKLPIAYLAEKGNKDFWQYKPTKYSDEIKEKVKSFGDNATVNDKEVAEFIKQVYTDQLAKSWNMDEVYARIKDGTATEIDKSDLAAFDEAIKGDTDPDTGLLYYGKADNLLYDIRREIWDSNKIDEYATERKARELVEFDQDFKKWAEEKYNRVEMDEKIFNGFTPSGNRRYLAHTLENVSKFMKQEGVRGGESINYGMGSARAMVTPKFSTLKQIRDNKDRLTDHATFEAAKDKLQDEYYWVTELLQGSLDDYDAGDARFIESIEKGYFDADYIRREYKDVKMTDDDAQRIAEFVQAMKEMPTEYFETKFERPIYTEDFGTSFAAAVLPETTDPAVISKLEEQGLLIFKYKNEQDREAVIKNALESANKTRQILFQTEAELYADARTFSTWQEFMDYYETMGKPEVTPIPYDADAQYYQTVWELAHNVTPEESINKNIVESRAEMDGMLPPALDSLFVANVVMSDEALIDFLETAAGYASINLNNDEYANVATEEEAQSRQRISDLQDYIKTVMYSRSFNEALNALKAGREIPLNVLKNVRGEMRDGFKSRDFRALYAEIMDDEMYAVEENDTVTAVMNRRREKNPERYYDIVRPDEDISKYSPEKRKQISLAMDNADLAAKIKSGKLKMNDEVHNYIKSLDKEIAGLKKDLRDQEIEIENDFKRIADAERRELLKLHDKMLIARNQYNKSNDEVVRKMNKGIKITAKYKRESQNLKANYDELFRKFSDLKNMITLDVQVQEALKRQEQVHQVREEINTKQQEKGRAAEEKKLRIQLVKRTMRRIDFTRIDYEDAKTIIAIQRLFEPNLLGGVNRWIGTEGPFLRGVISGILTDVEYKEEIEKYLRNNSRSSQAYVDFVNLLKNTKSLDDFNKWTMKDRKAALRYLPKENWIRDLNLAKLAKEREESIDLDIDTVEVQKPLIDEKTGKVKTYKNADGNTVEATTTSWKLQYSDEIAQRVKDAIGADMFNNLINVPFSEWTFEQLEELATRINGLYKQGRDMLEGKKLARKEAADKIRQQIESAVKNTGIIINDDDDDETKKRKQEKINKILGLTQSNTAGSDTSKDTGFKARINRLLHSYNDANVLRVARILDGYNEGTNVNELYRKEDTCYINKTRSMNERADRIQQVMKENNITPADLATVIQVTVPSYDAVNGTTVQEYTIDDLLYFAAAAEDYELDEKGAYDNFAACSRNAVMYGNMFASTADLEAKQAMAEDEEVDELGQSMSLKQYISRCNERFNAVLKAAQNLDPKFQALSEAIREDYAAQYDRMNKVSIEQFNSPVHRVKAYVPLNRLESNGDDNINKVREDLLAAMGSNATKQGVNKGMTARRVRMNPFSQKPVVTGLYKTWADSVERTEHFIAYAEYVNELNRVYKYRDANYTRQFIENRYGKGMIKYIDDYINEVANPNANKVREAGAELLHTLRGRTAPAYLAWKASAIIKQGLTSPWPFMQYINPAEYMAASWKAITSHGQIYKAIREKSVFMNNRVMDPMNDMIEEMAEHGKTKFDRFIGKQSQIGMAGLEWIDWMCVAPGWYAAYTKKFAELNGKNQAVYESAKARLEEENAYAEFGTSAWKSSEQIEAEAVKAMEDDVETKAVQYADDITRACQPSNRNTDISPLFKNSSEAMKAYLQFQTSLNVIWQNLRYDLPYAVKKEQFLQVAGCIVGYALAGIFMNSVMNGLPDDDEDKLKELTYYATTQFTDAVPMIGSELTNTMDKMITGKQQYMNSGTDMTPTATKIFSILTNAKKGNWKKAAEMIAEGIEMYLGLPVSGIKEIEKITGIGDGDGKATVDFGKVYGILDKED